MVKRNSDTPQTQTSGHGGCWGAHRGISKNLRCMSVGVVRHLFEILADDVTDMLADVGGALATAKLINSEIEKSKFFFFEKIQIFFFEKNPKN